MSFILGELEKDRLSQTQKIDAIPGAAADTRLPDIALAGLDTELQAEVRRQRREAARTLQLRLSAAAPMAAVVVAYTLITLARWYAGAITAADLPRQGWWLLLLLAFMLVPGRIVLMLARSQVAANGVICGASWTVLWLGAAYFVLTTSAVHVVEWPKIAVTRVSESMQLQWDNAQEKKAQQEAAAEPQSLADAVEAAMAGTSADANDQPDTMPLDEAAALAASMLGGGTGSQEQSNSATADVKIKVMTENQKREIGEAAVLKLTDNGVDLYKRHRGAMEQFLLAGGVNESWLIDKSHIEKQLAATRSLQIVNQKLLDQLVGAENELEQALLKNSLTAEEIQRLSPDASLEANLGSVRTICNAIHSALEDNRSALILLRQHWGDWEINKAGAIQWNKDFYASQRYTKLREQITLRLGEAEGMHKVWFETLAKKPASEPIHQ